MTTEISANNTRIAKNAMYMYLRMGIIMLVSLYTSRVVLSNLGITDYGIYNIVGGFIAAFSFVSGPLEAATQRFYNFELGRNNITQVNVVFNMSIIIYFVLSLILFILIEIIGLWFIQNKMLLPTERLNAAIFTFELSLVTFVFSLLKIPFDSLIIANEKMSFYAWMSIFDVVFRLLNAFSLTYFTIDKLELYSTNALIITLIGITFLVFYCLRKFKYVYFTNIKKIWDKKTFYSLFSFSGWSLFGSVATMTATQGLNILLNIFYGVIVNAAMGISNQINSAITQFVSNFQIAFRPQIVKYFAVGQIDELKTLINRTSRLSYMLLFGLLCPIWFNIHYLLDIWLGSENVPEYAAAFSILMTIYTLLESFSAPLWMTVQATGNIRKYQIIISSVIFMNIILAYIFLKLGFSPTVVLVIKCCLDLLYLMVRLLFMHSIINLSILSFFKKVIQPTAIVSLLSIVVLFLLSLIIHSGLIRLIVTVLTFVILYVPLVFYIGLVKSEQIVIINYISSKLIKLIE